MKLLLFQNCSQIWESLIKLINSDQSLKPAVRDLFGCKAPLVIVMLAFVPHIGFNCLFFILYSNNCNISGNLFTPPGVALVNLFYFKSDHNWDWLNDLAGSSAVVIHTFYMITESTLSTVILNIYILLFNTINKEVSISKWKDK